MSSCVEQCAKQGHDDVLQDCLKLCTTEEVPGAIIVGAGPSGMATAACLTMDGIPNIVIEKEDCIGHLWQNKTYDRLKLHISKEYCELPFMPFPESYPTFVTRNQFIDYLEDYARKFNITPKFCQAVQRASFSEGQWHVVCSSRKGDEVMELKEYVAKWLVVATGENAEAEMPCIPGLETFKGEIIHSSQYKNGSKYQGQKVLVVGCGNSGMEIAFDLYNYSAKPSIAVRSSVHILPKEVFGRCLFDVATKLMKVFSIQIVDHLLLLYSKFVIGNTESYGLQRPIEGPFELKMKTGKTPVLDVGTLAKIKSGHIKVLPNVKCITLTGVQFVNNDVEEYDTIVLATGYRSSVPHWLKHDGEFFSMKGFPKIPFPNNWKGNNGLYAAGLSKRGLVGSSIDAKVIAQDIKNVYYRDDNKTFLRSQSIKY